MAGSELFGCWYRHSSVPHVPAIDDGPFTNPVPGPLIQYQPGPAPLHATDPSIPAAQTANIMG
ncbi:MAG: hypothetical protein WCH85_07010, partial [Methanomicrobiales archaeon]